MNTDSGVKRVRSPNYPAMSLPEAVQQIQKLFGKIGQHPAPRDSIATSMGYSGLHGASATAISALAKYGLIERQGEDYKLSERSMKIIAPHTPAEKAEALKGAASEPALYAELIEHFKGDVPSDEVLRPFLIRKGFAQAAVATVISGYRDTMELVTREGGAYSGSGDGAAKKTDDLFKQGFDDFFKSPKPPADPLQKEAKLMEGERVVFAQEIEPDHRVRIVASGEVDGSILAAIDSYVEQHRGRFQMINLQKLVNAGFSEIPERELWFNRDSRMAFGHQAIRETDPQWMDRYIAEKVPDGDFVFHFVKPPKDLQNCFKILEQMELSNLRPNIRLVTIVG